MAKTMLGKGAVRIIHEAVDKLFDRLKARVLGRQFGPKQIRIGVPSFTLPDLFNSANREERNKPDERILDSLMRTADGFLEAQRHSTRTQVVKAVETFLADAEARGSEADVETVLGGQLGEVWGKAREGVQRIVNSEASNVRNTGTLDGIIKVNAANAIEDPIVYFVVVRDDSLCGECRKLHLKENGHPRLWYLSELGHGYHKRGQENPKIGGLHPNCRCSLVTLLPGYGFDDEGMVTFVGFDHDAMKKQRDE